LVDVEAPAAVITQTESKPELDDLSSGKSLGTAPKTGQEDTLDNGTKNKG
jgi:hypothetical protein